MSLGDFDRFIESTQTLNGVSDSMPPLLKPLLEKAYNAGYICMRYVRKIHKRCRAI